MKMEQLIPKAPPRRDWGQIFTTFPLLVIINIFETSQEYTTNICRDDIAGVFGKKEVEDGNEIKNPKMWISHVWSMKMRLKLSLGTG